MKKIILGWVIALGIMSLTTGCVQTQGSAVINDRKVTNKIRRGYTKSQVRSILGSPSSTMMLRNGEQWTYSYAEAKLNYGSYMARALTLGQAGGDMISGHKNTIYTIKFNNAGRVISKGYGY